LNESSIRRLLGGIAPGRIVVPDTETAEDLVAAVERIARDGREWVGVGSGALARAVAARQVTPQSAAGQPSLGLRSGPILLIGGSAHPANRTQIDCLARTRGVPVHELTLADPMAVVGGLVASLRRSHAAVLRLESRRSESGTVLAAVTAVAAKVVGECGVQRVFLTGGETAFALCQALGISALNFRAEIEPGLGLASGVARSGPMLLAVKPGGFGDERTWVRAWERLRGE
jgi:uncharacterized protein YgbK (DUF1537 family)